MTWMDQMGREIRLANPPARIISLVPSQTEFLCALGLSDKIVGITKFCIHPKECFESKNKIGGTKTFNFETIQALNPDLLIGNKEENEQSQIEALAQHYPVWMSDIYNLSDALAMMQALGQITQTPVQANDITQQIQDTFKDWRAKRPARRPKALYLIWQKPYMAAGDQTFIHHMLEEAGFENVLKGTSRYPSLLPEDIINLQPEILLLSSEPFPFKEKHLQALQNLCPKAQVMLVDGEMFSWYGSRLSQSAAYFDLLRKKLRI